MFHSFSSSLARSNYYYNHCYYLFIALYANKYCSYFEKHFNICFYESNLQTDLKNIQTDETNCQYLIQFSVFQSYLMFLLLYDNQFLQSTHICCLCMERKKIKWQQRKASKINKRNFNCNVNHYKNIPLCFVSKFLSSASLIMRSSCKMKQTVNE